MDIKITTENCTLNNYYEIEELADSAVILTISYPKIVTIQSKRSLVNEVVDTIQKELKKFKWLVCGRVRLDFGWFLNAVERQETDIIGDIDNITKPVQDALSGPNGLIIDDSQIGALYTYWMTRNGQVMDNVLVLKLMFNNEDAVMKDSLYFVQYDQAICVSLIGDHANKTDLMGARQIIGFRKKTRQLATEMKASGVNADEYLIRSNYDFHRTRLSPFADKVLTLAQFEDKCRDAGLV